MSRISILTALVVLLCAPKFTMAASGTLDNAIYNISSDTEFTIIVNAQDLAAAGGVDFTLLFDPAVITYVSTAVGTAMPSVDALFDDDSIPGELFVSTMSDDAVTGDGDVATVTFRTNASGGSTSISISEMIVYDFDVPYGDAFAIPGPDATVSVVTPILDITAPVRSVLSPSDVLALDTTETTLSVATDEDAVCHYSTSTDTLFADSDTFANTDTTSHTTNIVGLTNGTSYTYYIRCEDGHGNENTDDMSIVFSVASAPVITSSGGGGGGSSKDTSAPRRISILINGDDIETADRTVALTLTASDSDRKIFMQISEVRSFSGATWQDFETSVPWTFTQGNGVRTLYAKFKDSEDNISDIVSDSITLTEFAGLAYAPTTPEAVHNAVPAIQSSRYTFQGDLGMGTENAEVVELQRLLRSEGFFTYPTNSGYYGSITRDAVVKYQNHYGISPTGFVGPLTRAQLNSGNAVAQNDSGEISLESLVRLLIALGLIAEDKIDLALAIIAIQN